MVGFLTDWEGLRRMAPPQDERIFKRPKSSERPFIVTITKTGFSGTLCP